MSADISEITTDEAAEAPVEAIIDEVVEATTDDVAAAAVESVTDEATDETDEATTDESAGEPIETPASIAGLKPKMKVKGTVKRVDLYGAIIDLGIDATALIHISKLGSEQVNRVSDVLNEGDTVEAWVEKVDPDRQQVMLTKVEPVAVDWNDLKEGQTYTGTVTRLENFGAFISIGAEREGLVHISELSHDYVKSPGEVVSVGDEVTVKVLGFSRRKRRIDLSMKALMERPGGASSGGAASSGGNRGNSSSYTPDNAGDYDDIEDDYEELPTAMEIALRRALGNEGMETLKEEQRRSKNQKKQSSNKRQMQQEVIERILQMQSDN